MRENQQMHQLLFNLLVMYGGSYIFRHYIAILMERSAFHKSNPSSELRGVVDSYSTLPWVTWEVVTVVEAILCWGLPLHTLANGALVYPSQGGRYRAAWHWGSDCSVVNDPLGEQGRTPLSVGLLSTWGSVGGGLISFPILEEDSFFGDSSRHQWIKWPLARETDYLSP
jgi:hypothetical protein